MKLTKYLLKSFLYTLYSIVTVLPVNRNPKETIKDINKEICGNIQIGAFLIVIFGLWLFLIKSKIIKIIVACFVPICFYLLVALGEGAYLLVRKLIRFCKKK